MQNANSSTARIARDRSGEGLGGGERKHPPQQEVADRNKIGEVEVGGEFAEDPLGRANRNIVPDPDFVVPNRH